MRKGNGREHETPKKKGGGDSMNGQAPSSVTPQKNHFSVGDSLVVSDDDQKTVEAPFRALTELRTRLGELEYNHQVAKNQLLVAIDKATADYTSTIRSVMSKYGANVGLDSPEKWSWTDGTITRTG